VERISATVIDADEDGFFETGVNYWGSYETTRRWDWSSGFYLQGHEYEYGEGFIGNENYIHTETRYDVLYADPCHFENTVFIEYSTDKTRFVAFGVTVAEGPADLSGDGAFGAIAQAPPISTTLTAAYQSVTSSDPFIVPITFGRWYHDWTTSSVKVAAIHDHYIALFWTPVVTAGDVTYPDLNAYTFMASDFSLDELEADSGLSLPFNLSFGVHK
jgi:hypothetical protein